VSVLRDYQDAHSLTDEEMARDLSALLGRRIGAAGYKLHAYSAKRDPKAWTAALGLADDDGGSEIAAEPGWLPDEDGGPPPLSEGEREPGTPPRAPQGARVDRPSLEGDYTLVKQRLVQAYAAIGAGTSMITRNQGHAAVFDGYAPNLAQAWIDAARTNENVAKIVKFMETGGPVGELVIGHIILVGGLIYVSGRGPDLYVLYGGKFEGYRTAAAAGRLADEAAAASNGAAPAGAEAAVADGSF